MMMVFKITGAILVLAACSGLGFSLAQNWTKHLESLQGLRKMILLLKSEIIYTNAPLAEALELIGHKSEDFWGEFFIRVSDRIKEQSGELFYPMWKQEVDKIGKEAFLSSQDRKELSAFGEHLGYLDLVQQERTILLYIEQLELTIEYLRSNQREKKRLYSSLGVMGGLFLMIIML